MQCNTVLAKKRQDEEVSSLVALASAHSCGNDGDAREVVCISDISRSDSLSIEDFGLSTSHYQRTATKRTGPTIRFENSPESQTRQHRPSSTIPWRANPGFLAAPQFASLELSFHDGSALSLG
jgi:hypothetical protein